MTSSVAMNWLDLLPEEIWCLIFSYCLLEDVVSLKEAFGSLFEASADWIMGYKSVTPALIRLRSLTTVPPYLGTNLSLRDFRPLLDDMKKEVAKHEGVRFTTWIDLMYRGRIRRETKNNWWSVLVKLSQEIPVNLEVCPPGIRGDPRILLAGARMNPRLMEQISNKNFSPATVRWLVGSWKTLKYLGPEVTGDLGVMTYAVSVDPKAYRYVTGRASASLELVLEVTKTHTDLIWRFAGRFDRNLMKKVLEANPNVFPWCEEFIRSCWELVEVVISQEPKWFSSVGASVREDLEYSRRLVSSYPRIFPHVSSRLQEDPEVVLEVVRDRPGMYVYCTGAARNDARVVREVLRGNPSMVSEVPKKFRE